MKLGEALIEKGLITRQQLGEALERQSVLGGRIDTNIVELRFLSDQILTGFLGKFLRLPVVTAEALSAIPEEVIRTVGRETAENFMIIPFALDRQRLHVGMLNPKNLRDIENLRFMTGYDIIPYVVTESRLLYALEKYYGIKRETRYISLQDRFDPEENSKTMSERIERISGEAVSPVKDNIERPAEMRREEYPRAEEKVRTAPGLTEALLLNAIYSARLLYAEHGLAADNSSVEDEVLTEWVRLSEKLRRRKGLRTPSRI